MASSTIPIAEIAGDFSASVQTIRPCVKVASIRTERAAAMSADPKPVATPLVPVANTRSEQEEPYLEPVDLQALMDAEPPEEEWLAEPLLPARGSTTIVATRGVGKSLIALDLCAAKAAGEPFLSQPAGPPIHVGYFDLEMGPEDLYARLADLGYTPDHPRWQAFKEHLHYFQFIDLPPLDTEAGGRAVELLVERWHLQLVVFDSISQAVIGEESPPETWRNLYANTGVLLKRRKIPVLKTDNFGKDTSKGSRGSSAKEDKEDVMWEMKPGKGNVFIFKATKRRFQWVSAEVEIIRTDVGNRTTHQLTEPFQVPLWIQESADRLDILGIPVNVTVRDTATALRADGKKLRQSEIGDVARFRKRRLADEETQAEKGKKTIA